MTCYISIMRLHRWEFFRGSKKYFSFWNEIRRRNTCSRYTKVFNGSAISSRLVSKLADRTRTPLRNSGGENQVSVHLRTIVKARGNNAWSTFPSRPLRLNFLCRRMFVQVFTRLSSPPFFHPFYPNLRSRTFVTKWQVKDAFVSSCILACNRK